jgi:SAM-dependent methyltransferase
MRDRPAVRNVVWRPHALAAYRRWRLWIEPERLRLRRVVRGWLKDSPPGSKLVEVGAGTAFMEPVLRQDIPDLLYVKGEIAPTENTTVVFDAAAFPLADASVDIVMALEVLEHMSAPQHLLDEAARVLRPGGHLVLTVPFMFGVHDLRDYYRYTPLGLQSLLEPRGLTLTETVVRGGTFVAASGLIRNLILNAIVGRPQDWRARSRAKQLRWLVSTVVLTPWTVITYLAYALDSLLDPQSVSPPGYFFLATAGNHDRMPAPPR